jgi:hypothetical protein
MAAMNKDRWHSSCAFNRARMLEHAMIEVRFHGRGGQGAKLASRILG